MSPAGHVHGPTSGKRLWMSLGLTLVFCTGEAIAGALSHSLALMSDAGHNLSDALALGLAAYAIQAIRRPAKGQHTYGYVRVSTLTALFNAATLVVIAVLIALEAVGRFLHPVASQGTLMIYIAGVSVLMNTVIAVALAGDAKHSLNSRAAMIHMAGDAISAAGVVVAGIVVRTTGWMYADPLVSVMIAGFIFWSALDVLREAGDILMEKAPRDLDLEQVAAEISATERVCGMHDLHVWTVGEGGTLLSCHICFAEGTSLESSSETIAEISARLQQTFGIHHATIQPEISGSCGAAVAESIYCQMPSHGARHRHSHSCSHG